MILVACLVCLVCVGAYRWVRRQGRRLEQHAPAVSPLASPPVHRTPPVSPPAPQPSSAEPTPFPPAPGPTASDDEELAWEAAVGAWDVRRTARADRLTQDMGPGEIDLIIRALCAPLPGGSPPKGKSSRKSD